MLLLDTIDSVETFVNVFIGVYGLVLIAYIITSWIRLPYSLRGLQRFLDETAGPYLRFWRRLLPFSAGGIDFSPIVGFVALSVLATVIRTVLDHLR